MSEQRMKKNIEKEHLSPTVPAPSIFFVVPPCEALISSRPSKNELLCGRVTCKTSVRTALLFTIMMNLPFYYWKTSLNPDASLLYGTDQCDRQEEPVPVISHLPSFRVPTQAGTWQAAEGCHPFLVRFNNMVQENAVCRQHVMRSFLCM
ncbi:hypothetical protein TcBrA4_0064650, partial [Trypanosoma cruzi]